jgi:hypothetical protein
MRVFCATCTKECPPAVQPARQPGPGFCSLQCAEAAAHREAIAFLRALEGRAPAADEAPRPAAGGRRAAARDE